MVASDATLQNTVEENKRGRVMRFYTMAFFGMGPLGSLLPDLPIHRLDRLQGAHRQDDAAGRGRRIPRVHANKLPTSTLTFSPHGGYGRAGPKLDDYQTFRPALRLRRYDPTP